MGKAAGWRMTIAVAMLLAGGALYLTFRPRDILMFHIADAASLTDMILKWREGWSDIRLPEWVIYNLPGTLWVSAYILVIDTLLSSHGKWKRLLCAGFIPLVGVVSELMQGMAILPGTSDGDDVVAYIVPYVIYILINNLEKTHRL